MPSRCRAGEIKEEQKSLEALWQRFRKEDRPEVVAIYARLLALAVRPGHDFRLGYPDALHGRAARATSAKRNLLDDWIDQAYPGVQTLPSRRTHETEMTPDDP